VAVRAAASLGISVSVVWAAVDLRAGLITVIGAFSAVYCSDRPYRNRAIVLGGIVGALAMATCLGAWTRTHPTLDILAVAVAAMIATFICYVLRIGPPGAYMLVLACAIGTALPIASFGLWQIALLVCIGGATAWIVHMLGVFVDFRGPERSAVLASAKAVATFAQADRGPQAERACEDAARALHDAWIVLVSLQPARPRPNGRLQQLRVLNHELHRLFAECIVADDETADANRGPITHRTLEIAEAARQPFGRGDRSEKQFPVFPLGGLGMRLSIRGGLRLRSPAFATTRRVGLAVVVAGGIGTCFGIVRPYWAMAAAVLVLHAGGGWNYVLRRGIERTAGTLAGLGLIAVLLRLHLAGVQLVCALVVMQFTIEMLVPRNYALAAIFITPLALLVGSGGDDASLTGGGLLWARAEETILGCATGMLVYALTASRRPNSIRSAITRAIASIAQLIEPLATGDVSTPGALIVRRDLQHALIALVLQFETQFGSAAKHSNAAACLRPAVAAVVRLGYKVLAACWSRESLNDETNATHDSGLRANDTPILSATFDRLIEAYRNGSAPLVLPELSLTLRSEVAALNSALAPIESGNT